MEDPTGIDWRARQAEAAVPFELDIDGLPVNPTSDPTLPAGRGDLPHWGERMCGDAYVTARRNGQRYVLLGERSDRHGWALPGGKTELGEDPIDTAVRELDEETGLKLFRTLHHHVADPPRVVPDPRAGRRAWLVTVLVKFDLGEVDDLPTVTPRPGEFEQVTWAPADTYDDLVQHLADTYGGEIGVAHQQMIAEALSA